MLNKFDLYLRRVEGWINCEICHSHPLKTVNKNAILKSLPYFKLPDHIVHKTYMVHE